MSNFIDISGKRFGRLTALKRTTASKEKTKWLCKCDCGAEKCIPLDSLSSGKGISCGCYRREVTSERRSKGIERSRIYTIWYNMKRRCENEKIHSYRDYGAKGVSVCEEWQSFENFYNWALINGYKKELTIDRIDSNGNYDPDNCRWATRLTQANNTTKNVFATIEGVKRTLSEHARHYNVNYYTLHKRYKRGLKDLDLILSKTEKRKIK